MDMSLCLDVASAPALTGWQGARGARPGKANGQGSLINHAEGRGPFISLWPHKHNKAQLCFPCSRIVVPRHCSLLRAGGLAGHPAWTCLRDVCRNLPGPFPRPHGPERRVIRATRPGSCGGGGRRRQERDPGCLCQEAGGRSVCEEIYVSYAWTVCWVLRGRCM